LWLVAVALLVAGVLVGVAVTRSRHKNTAASTSVPTSSSSVPTSVPVSGPIPLPTLASKMGLSTGVQLWNATPAQMDSEISGIAAAGAKWVRTSLLWRDVEPVSANQDDWSRSDRIVADSRRDGVQVIFTLGGAPDWAGAQQSGEFSTDAQLYAQFAAKVAARYRGQVRVYELGNEPNGTNYVPHPDAATYVAILKASYPAIKKADPEAVVLTAGLAGSRDKNGNIAGDTFISEMYQDGAKGYFDALSFHPYTYPLLASQDATGGTRSWSLMLRVRAIMVANGDANKQIWVTEYGAPTNGPRSVSEQQQAAMLQDAFQLWSTYPWGGIISWFDYQDKGNDTTTHKDFFGLITTTGAHKPAYAAYASLAHS
jgi:hypothetical protein